MNELLLEFYSEEMPAMNLGNSAKNFHDLLKSELIKKKITVKESQFFYAPTRLAFIFYGLKYQSNKKETLIRGPQVESATKAIEGFAKSNKVKVKDLIKQKTKKGEYYFFKENKKELPFETILAENLQTSLLKLSWKKSMRWGRQKSRWVRPLKNILCILNGKILRMKFYHFNANKHLFSRDKNILIKHEVDSIKSYFKVLEKLRIKIKQSERRALILQKAKNICDKKKLKFLPDEFLLEEVSNLVEKPNIFLAKFKKDYLKLPREVLITSMQKNQRYFPLYKNDGFLANTFLLVANLAPIDKGKMIVEGNERVINARLSDAEFFWNKDLKNNFHDEKKKLEKLIFHNEIGNVSEKILRLKTLVTFLSNGLKSTEKKYLLEAADLCKNDLVSEIVREFPSLQGVMAKYYILKSGQHIEVANAVQSHYKPQGPTDDIPNTLLSRLLSIADKIDNLVGFFIIDKYPTGSKDPFALRRTALGVIRVLIEGEVSVDIAALIEKSLKSYVNSFHQNKLKNHFESEVIKQKVLGFLLERYENLIKEDKKIDFVVFNSLKINTKKLNILEIHSKGKILTNYINTKEGKLFLSSFKRVINIIDSDLLKKQSFTVPDLGLLSTKEELNLFKLVNGNKKFVATNDFDFLNKLSIPIKNFFDNVTIKDRDKKLRQNRINLLGMINTKVNILANFSMIIKGKEL